MKRPGSAESRIEPYEPSPAGTARHVIDVTSVEAPTMAQKKARQTGTYTINGDFLRFREGDVLPDGAAFVEADRDSRFIDREEIASREEAEALATALATAEAEKRALLEAEAAQAAQAEKEERAKAEAAAKAQQTAPENKAAPAPENKAEKDAKDK